MYKRMFQSGVLASMLFLGSSFAESDRDSSMLGVVNHEAEYGRKGYSKVQGSEQKYGFPLYLTQMNTNVVSELEHALLKLPLSIKRAIVDLRIDSRDAEKSAGIIDVGGRATNGRVAIYDKDGIEKGTFYHEVAHAWTHSLSRENLKAFLDEWQAIAKFEYSTGHTHDSMNWRGEDLDRLLQVSKQATALMPKLESKRKELEKAKGTIGPYNAAVASFNQTAEEYNLLSAEYNILFEKTSAPKYGVFSAYGSTDILEDIAEASKTIFLKPDQAKRLMQDSDQRFARKMRLFSDKTGINLDELLIEKKSTSL